MKPHLSQAHQMWKNWVQPGDTVIDATIGNGHDTFILATLLQGKGRLIGYDIQPQAIEQTQKRLEGLSPPLRDVVSLKLDSHTHFSEREVKLIVYNLGYLPGGNKTVTTQTETTLLSLKKGMECLSKGGAISITCYPGHPEGAHEQAAIIEFLKTLPSSEWEICHYVWLNRPASPSWIWMRGP